MSTVIVKGIGPAELRIIEMLMQDITRGDRNNARMVKTLRRQFGLRRLKDTIDEILDGVRADNLETYRNALKDMMTGALSDTPEQLDKRINNMAEIYARHLQALRPTWEMLEDAGYWFDEEDNNDKYGEEYKVDETALRWLVERREEREVWVGKAERGKSKPKEEAELIPLEMLTAIGNFDEAVGEALGGEPDESA